MSTTPITGQKKPFICFCCRHTIKDGEEIFLALDSKAIHLPDNHNDPDIKWITEMDWTQEFYFHKQCFIDMKSREWDYQLTYKR